MMWRDRFMQYDKTPILLSSMATKRYVPLSAFWERGSPDLPACGLRPAAWLERGPAQPIFINTRPKTLARGQASQGGRHGSSSRVASSGWLTRRRRDQGGVPREVPMTQAMTTKGARRAPARAVSSLSSLVQRGQARARGSSKGTHFGATRPRPVQRWEGGHRGAQNGVTTGPLAGEDQL